MNKAKYAKNTEGLLSGQVSIKSSMDFRTDLGIYIFVIQQKSANKSKSSNKQQLTEL